MSSIDLGQTVVQQFVLLISMPLCIVYHNCPKGLEISSVKLGTPARSNLCGFSAQIVFLSTQDSPDSGRFRAEM
jgi:hypothetical protein